MPLPYPIFQSGGGAAPAVQTTVDNGGEWAWPNIGEPAFVPFADVSSIQVGQRVFVDDGSNRGLLLVAGVGDTFPDFVNLLNDSPPGGTTMADGAVVLVIPEPA